MQKKSRHARIENTRRSRLSPTLSASSEGVPCSAVSSRQLVWSIIRPGRCPEQKLIALRTSMINQSREVFCQGRFPASLIYADCDPMARCLVDFYADSLSL